MINNKVMNFFNLVTIQNIGLDRLRHRPSDNDDDEKAQIDHLGPQAPPTRPLKFLQQMAQADHQKPIYESLPDQS